MASSSPPQRRFHESPSPRACDGNDCNIIISGGSDEVVHDCTKLFDFLKEPPTSAAAATTAVTGTRKGATMPSPNVSSTNWRSIAIS
jgi:hypothetical protein